MDWYNIYCKYKKKTVEQNKLICILQVKCFAFEIKIKFQSSLYESFKRFAGRTIIFGFKWTTSAISKIPVIFKTN